MLALAPDSKGFGFAVLESPKNLIDYGAKKVKGDKTSASLIKINNLIDHYQPDVVVLRDFTRDVTRHSPRVRQLSQEISIFALCQKVKVRNVSRIRIIKRLSLSARCTKHQIASRIAKELPELASRLPSSRMPWMSEDERMSIFDAVALALTLMGNSRKEQDESLGCETIQQAKAG